MLFRSGYLAVRFPSRWTVLMERAAYLAQGVPGIVVALALISLTVQWVGPLYQSPALLVLAYAILFLPLALVSVRATLTQIPPGLEEAGRSLGQNSASVAWRVVAPLAANGLGAGAFIRLVPTPTRAYRASPRTRNSANSNARHNATRTSASSEVSGPASPVRYCA